MITLKKCKELLEKTGKKYTDEELILIREFLTNMAKINIDIIINLKKKKDEKSSDNV